MMIMDSILEVDLILNRKKYSVIYNFSLIIMVILLILIYIIFTYKYHSYYVSLGKIVDGNLELACSINDIKYIKNNSVLEIDGNIYSYRLVKISEETYATDDYTNYKYVYLDVSKLDKINNLVYLVKISKENKVLAQYFKDYL